MFTEQKSLNKAASASQSILQSLMRPESRESTRPLFRASSKYIGISEEGDVIPAKRLAKLETT
jgi:hypothetical protein